MANERKLFKTKLCILYQRGRCLRHSCSFAHGNTDLRGSFNERRYQHRDGVSRNAVERRHSPERRYTSRRTEKGLLSHHGHSPSRSSDINRKKQLLKGQSDMFGSPMITDENEDLKERKVKSFGSKDPLLDQLTNVKSDIKILDHRKNQIELDLEDSAQEVDSLTSRIQDLEAQLHKEKSDCKRVTSKIKKFLKAHNRHLKIQDELKRSQAQLRKLGDQLGTDTTRDDVVEEDLTVDIVSDEETNNKHFSPQNMLRNVVAPSKKRSRINLNAAAAKEATPSDDDDDLTKAMKSKKASQWNVNNENCGIESADESNKPKKRVKNVSTRSRRYDKLKDMANDEAIDDDEKLKVLGNVYEYNGVVVLPPPPPLQQQLKKGDEENVNEEEEDVDII